MISLSIPHNFAFTRVKLQSLIYSAHDRPISFKTVVIAEMLSILVQARIHTGFQRFTEIGQIFHNKYIFNKN